MQSYATDYKIMLEYLNLFILVFDVVSPERSSAISFQFIR